MNLSENPLFLESDSEEKKTNQAPGSPVNQDVNDCKCVSEGDPSVQEAVEETGLKQDKNALVLAYDASIDSISGSDYVEGHSGSSSDGTVLPGRGEGMSDAGASNSYWHKENEACLGPTDNYDLFEPPSFMTLVEPQQAGNAQLSSSTEFQSANETSISLSPPWPDGWFPSVAPGSNDSRGRKKNAENIAKIANRDPGKLRTPSKGLLAEANLEKIRTHPQEMPTTKDHQYERRSPMVQTPSKLLSELKPSIKMVIEKKQNSPRSGGAKREKMRREAKWVKFVCCS